MKTRLHLLLLIIIFCILSINCYCQTWSEPELISEDDPFHSYPDNSDMTVDNDGNIWCVWSSEVNSDSSNMYVRYYDSNNWSETMTVVEDTCTIYNPKIAVDLDNNVWLVWTRCFYYGILDFTYKVFSSYYNGTAWSPMEQVSPDSGWAEHPSITVTPDEEIWVAYMFGPLPYGSTFRPFVTHWEEDYWSEPTDIGDRDEALVWEYFNTAICGDCYGGIWAAWITCRGDIGPPITDTMMIAGNYYDGEEWGEPVIITKECGNCDGAHMMQLARDSLGRVWICYRYYSGPGNVDQIKANYAIADTWSETPILVWSNPGHVDFSDIIVDDEDKVWIAWGVPNQNQNYILARYYHNGTWSDTSFVSVGAERALYPSLTKDNSDHIFCMWLGISGMETDFYVNHCDAGSNAIEEPNIPIDEPYIHLSAYPNPFKSNINIELNWVPVKGDQEVEVEIYNIKAQLVRTLIPMTNIIWDGKTENGNVVSNGLYFIKVEIKNVNVVKKVIKLK